MTLPPESTCRYKLARKTLPSLSMATTGSLFACQTWLSAVTGKPPERGTKFSDQLAPSLEEKENVLMLKPPFLGEVANHGDQIVEVVGISGYILTLLGDRMEMAHSVEGRVPFLDHHVVEVIRSQPVNQKVRGMTEKYVLREAARDVITDTVYRRQKHPFLSPPATLNPDQRLNAFVQDTLRGPTLASIPFFDRSKVVGLLDRLHTMDDGTRVANDQTLMTLVSACVLHDQFHLA